MNEDKAGLKEESEGGKERCVFRKEIRLQFQLRTMDNVIKSM